MPHAANKTHRRRTCAADFLASPNEKTNRNANSFERQLPAFTRHLIKIHQFAPTNLRKERKNNNSKHRWFYRAVSATRATTLFCVLRSEQKRGGRDKKGRHQNQHKRPIHSPIRQPSFIGGDDVLGGSGRSCDNNIIQGPPTRSMKDGWSTVGQKYSCTGRGGTGGSVI